MAVHLTREDTSLESLDLECPRLATVRKDTAGMEMDSDRSPWPLRIPEHPDGESGNIRTRNRKYPDTLPAKLIVK